MKQIVDKIYERILRNQLTIDNTRVKKNEVNLEWWDGSKNLGDSLSEVVFRWMLLQRGLSGDEKTKKTIHLMGIGSLIGMGRFDATVWGSGILNFLQIYNVAKQSRYRKYDVRAVRGPITRKILIENGYNCPAIMGDPAILMPLIYQPQKAEKCYDISIIQHWKYNDNKLNKLSEYHHINIETDDYKSFVDELVKSKRIISSSLHGIILAETYGIPAVLLNTGIDEEMIKFYDWYLSTGRKKVIYAETLEEAIQMNPMPLPDLNNMRQNLLKTFPYDLWE